VTDKRIILPFLKWAGGKRWLVNNHIEKIPNYSGKYIEPFLGSGAMFFSINPKSAILSDVNIRLINCYSALKSRPDLVLRYLKEFSLLHSKENYYKIRSIKFSSFARSAAQFIYLNRTCFNGIYRENKSGIFNVPMGSKTSVLLSTDDFFAISEALSKAEILSSDFEEIIGKAGPGDLLFVDPPYTVRHNNNGFVKYNQKMFNWEDQVRLRDVAFQARSRGAMVIVTNADHDSIRDIYCEAENIDRLSRLSVIGGLGARRGSETELLITL